MRIMILFWWKKKKGESYNNNNNSNLINYYRHEIYKLTESNFFFLNRYTLKAKCHSLELELERNNGFWVGKPQEWGHVTQKLKEKCTVDVPKKTQRGFYIYSYLFYFNSWPPF